MRRFGLVDIGSNAIRTRIIAAVGPSITVLGSWRDAVRLGDDVFRNGRIRDEHIAETVAALRTFHARCGEHGVERIAAIATAALRRAANGAALVAQIEAATGIAVETITGDAEAELVVLAVSTCLDLSGGVSVLADLGSGSLEIALVRDGATAATQSLPLGALLLHRETGGELAALRDRVAVHAKTLRGIIGTAQVTRCVALGGNIDTLTKLAGSDALGVREITTAQLTAWIERLAACTVEQRIVELDLQPDRADTILAAAIVYDAVARAADVPSVLVPRIDLRAGLAQQVAAGRGSPWRPRPG